jgi:hypothetical protein
MVASRPNMNVKWMLIVSFKQQSSKSMNVWFLITE